ncbi:MAG: hypothetical protein HYZ57_18325 [Acidobacteria bacterium]|nr:hypothetical protein [Acidobacteriota bacterium]
MSRRRRLTWVLDWLLLFLIAAALIRPLFKVKYMDKWYSIESTFISDARFLKDHWPHPRWQPFWYTGTRFDFVYPPALRYGTAALARYYPGMLPVRAYHIYVAFFYCFGIAGVYLFVRIASGSRGAAWLAALATALLSPTFLFLASNRGDSLHLMPWRLSVLVHYGEGPHITALAWMPYALAFAWRALEARRPVWLALAALAGALVVSHNFYGATALAMLSGIQVWSLYITRLDARIWLRAGGIAALAYGLTAFWLAPTYVTITLQNMQFVSEAGNLWSRWVALGVVALVVLLSNNWFRGRADQAYTVFLFGALLWFTVNILGHYALNFRVVGEPTRLVPELDLVYVLAAAEALRRFWSWNWRLPILAKATAAAVTIAAFSTSLGYVRNAWGYYQKEENVETRVEYRLQDWMASHHPNYQTMVSGSVRFWWNAWHDLSQLGGGSEQGLLNPLPVPPQWEILQGEDVELSILWLQALGADAIVVNMPNSDEHYHDYLRPEKFVGRLAVLHDDGRGNVIYKVPRRYAGPGRLVETAKLNALPPQPSNTREGLQALVDVIEKGPEAPVDTNWESPDVLRIRARVEQGQSIFLQVSHDTPWRATSAGRRLPADKSVLGFMRIDAPPGEHDITLVHDLPLENVLGRVLTLLSLALLIRLAWQSYRDARAMPSRTVPGDLRSAS